eukprot:6319808-Pyramimonas_sp.AAC.1
MCIRDSPRLLAPELGFPGLFRSTRLAATPGPALMSFPACGLVLRLSERIAILGSLGTLLV